MSAFIVSHNHINAIVRFASQHNINGVAGNEQVTAELLLAENTRSVNYRYKESAPVEAIIFAADAPELTPIEAIKACNCLDYQSCETEDWRSTPACELLDAIKSDAARRLAGYEDVPWEIA